MSNTDVPFNENEPFETRRAKALEEVREVLKKYQVQMRAEFISDVVSIRAALVVHDVLPQAKESDVEYAD